MLGRRLHHGRGRLLVSKVSRGMALKNAHGPPKQKRRPKPILGTNKWTVTVPSRNHAICQPWHAHLAGIWLTRFARWSRWTIVCRARTSVTRMSRAGSRCRRTKLECYSHAVLRSYRLLSRPACAGLHHSSHYATVSALDYSNG